MALDQDVVVTGVGVVSPIGIGKEAFWTALGEGRSGIRTLPYFSAPGMRVPFGGEVPDFDPKQYVRPRKSLKVMSRDIQLAFAAADMACADAGLRQGPLDPERMGVVLGADMMPCDLDELLGTYRGCLVEGRFDFRRWGQAFPAELFPLWMLKYLPNMPACHIGIAQDARGHEQYRHLGRGLHPVGHLRSGPGARPGTGRRDHCRRSGRRRFIPPFGHAIRCWDTRSTIAILRPPAAPSMPSATAWSTAKGPGH